MLGYTDLLKVKFRADVKAQTYLDNIEKAGERATNMVSQLLNLARENGGTQERVKLDELINELEVLTTHLLINKIKFKVELFPDKLVVMGDANLLIQVLLNIAINAIHVLKNAENPILTIRTSTACITKDFAESVGMSNNRNYAVISIADNGCGIKPEHLNLIFEPFFTTKGKKEGTGFGLATSFNIVKNHGGTIEVFSREGKWTVFNIYLPCIE